MVQIIRVGPIDGGWVVDCEGAAEPAVFLSGGKAEAIARATAARLAASGVDVRVEIVDRSQRPAGSSWFSGDYPTDGGA